MPRIKLHLIFRVILPTLVGATIYWLLIDMLYIRDPGRDGLFSGVIEIAMQLAALSLHLVALIYAIKFLSRRTAIHSNYLSALALVFAAFNLISCGIIIFLFPYSYIGYIGLY